jgi:hypothetical protein
MHSPDPAGQRRLQLDFLTDMMNSLAAGTTGLPAFPQVVIKVQELYKDPNYTPQMIVRHISAERGSPGVCLISRIPLHSTRPAG